MKRITSIILSIVMLISTTSSIVFANDEINVFNEPQDGYEVTLEENAALLEPSSENSISLFSAESVTNSKKDDITRYTVLALDTSGSMYGKPMTAAKSAAIKFCEDILNAIRPVFCVKNNTIINQNSDIIIGKTVFVIE